jgi:Lar family restriction alleviation protein
MSEELKPCPFCGCVDVRPVKHSKNFDGTMLTSINCQDCGATTLGDDSEAARKWNTRNITLDQAKQVLAEAGMVAVPLQADDKMSSHILTLWTSNWHHPAELYRSLIKAAQEKPDA